MTVYSYSQLEGLWIQAGGSRSMAPLMAAIALAESSGNSAAMNFNDNGGTQTSVGLWQVSTGTHSFPAVWRTALGNAREAVNKLHTQGLTAWGTFTSGAYKQFLRGNVPPSAVKGGGGAGGPGGVQTTAFNPLGGVGSDLLGGLSSALGLPSPKDMMIRFGFVILGGLLLVVGVFMLAGKQAIQVGVEGIAPESRAALAATGSTSRAREARSRSSAPRDEAQAAARESRAERSVQLAESREARARRREARESGNS